MACPGRDKLRGAGSPSDRTPSNRDGPAEWEEIQADWAERLGSEAMGQLLDLLQQLNQVLGFEYSRRIGGLPNDTS
jgi:hypothetical protein